MVHCSILTPSYWNQTYTITMKLKLKRRNKNIICYRVNAVKHVTPLGVSSWNGYGNIHELCNAKWGQGGLPRAMMAKPLPGGKIMPVQAFSSAFWTFFEKCLYIKLFNIHLVHILKSYLWYTYIHTNSLGSLTILLMSTTKISPKENH